MKKSYTIFFIVIILSVKGYSKNKGEIIPPNGLKLNDSVFIDKTEVTNLDYNEYLYWTERVLTKESVKYKNAQPKQIGLWNECFITDTTKEGLVYLRNPCQQYYLTHPAFNNYPLVGINYEQALNYCNWRSDRIYEMLLVKNNVLDLYSKQDSITCFTIEKFLSKEISFHLEYKERIKSIPIFRYRLPDISEYTLALKTLDTCKFKHLYLLVSDNDSVSIEAVSPGYKGPKKYMYHLYDNASELVFEKGIIFGGNWKDKTYHSNFTQIINREPSNYIGFRCVAVKEFPSKDCKVLKE
ncbi:MAG: SUMF1/EgtB/PvdO family nonheme iron enzyme [Chitinophagales bacterium]|nr:SUMF1/EgtB/PvdO family nonheme iron enzyme [Chitinophagales bacterium]